MKRIIFCLAVALTTASAFAGNGKVHKHQDRVPGQYIVTFKNSINLPAGLAKELVKLHGGDVIDVYTQTIKGMAFGGTEKAAEAISRDPRVESVEEDPIGYVTQTAPVDPPTGPGWAKDRVDRKPLPLNGTYTVTRMIGFTSAIYVMDTGITDLGTEFTHLIGGQPVTRLRNLYKYSSTIDFSDHYGGNGHGTGVAVAAAGRTLGIGRGAEIVNVKVCTMYGQCLGSRMLSALEAINADFLANNPLTTSYGKPAVVNISIGVKVGSDPYFPAVENSIRAMIQNGIAFVVAAGNDGSDPRSFFIARMGQPNTHLDSDPNNDSDNPYPEHVTTVGGTSLLPPNYDQDYVWDDGGATSAIGPSIDIWAPAYQVDVMSKTGALIKVNGTSYATPYVAGALSSYAADARQVGLPRNATTAGYWETQLLSASARGYIWNRATSSNTDLSGAPNTLLYVY